MGGKGKPFLPGQSGNPRGRPVIAEQVKELARQHTPRAIEVLAEELESSDSRTRIMAANSILDRACGKPASIDEAQVIRDAVAQLSQDVLEAAARVSPTAMAIGLPDSDSGNQG